ncbi:S1 family peptidase [Prescottella soli]|uniref:S1 family peptidase n=1 Tax=Prescottella soli TaxID=1543852 RepID=A0ABW9FYQ6_9NOCA
MRKKSARCAATVGTAVALAALSLPGTGQAAPSADRLPAGLVAAIQRDLHLTPQEYLERADAAQQVAGYASDLRRVDPGAFGGARLDLDGVPTVAVTSPEAAARVVAAGYRAEFVPSPIDAPEGTPVQPNRRSNTPMSVPRFEVASGTDPIGGDAYITTVEPIATARSFMVCSFGFTAADSAGTPLALSAGHCDPSRATAGTANAAAVYAPNRTDIPNSPRVGEFARSGIGSAGGGLDYSVIRLTPEAAAGGLGKPTVRGADGDVLTITGTAVPVAGAPVCKSGQRSGYTCGTVQAAAYTTDLFGNSGESWSVHGFTHDACTLAGDSGGAIITGTRALGITSGSTVADAAGCTQAVAAGGVLSFGIPVRDILAQVNGSSCAAGSGIAVRTAANPTGMCETPEPAPGSSNPFGSLGSTGS